MSNYGYTVEYVEDDGRAKLQLQQPLHQEGTYEAVSAPDYSVSVSAYERSTTPVVSGNDKVAPSPRVSCSAGFSAALLMVIFGILLVAMLTPAWWKQEIKGFEGQANFIGLYGKALNDPMSKHYTICGRLDSETELACAEVKVMRGLTITASIFVVALFMLTAIHGANLGCPNHKLWQYSLPALSVILSIVLAVAYYQAHPTAKHLRQSNTGGHSQVHVYLNVYMLLAALCLSLLSTISTVVRAAVRLYELKRAVPRA